MCIYCGKISLFDLEIPNFLRTDKILLLFESFFEESLTSSIPIPENNPKSISNPLINFFIKKIKYFN